MTDPTSRPVSHDEAWDALPGVALDAASDDETRAALAHVRTCERCSAELARLRAVAAQLTYGAPLEAVVADADGAAMRARLLARAAATSTDEASARPLRAAAGRATASGGRGRALRPWLLAGGLGALAAASAFAVVRRERIEARAALARQSSAAAAEVAALRRDAAEQRRLLDEVTGPSVALIRLTSSSGRLPSASVFWDRAAGRWTLFARDLPRPPAGRVYQVWLVTAGGKRSAGLLSPRADGSGELHAVAAIDSAALRSVAVTVEPEGGVPEPTGPVLMAGDAQSR